MFNQRFSELLELSGLSQTELGKRTGIPQTTLNAYLTTKGEPGLTRAASLAEHFGVSIDYISGRQGIEKEYTYRVSKLPQWQQDAISQLLGTFEIQNALAEQLQDTIDDDDLRISDPSIYFILAPSAQRIKIGYSGNPNKRINQLLTSSPHELEVLLVIPGTRDEERSLHERFAHLRQHREWFTDCEELREYINHLT